MKIDKFDIGAEVISILTRGMYPDPRDAVREYIQNAIDASSTNVDVKVRQGSVVIEDNGVGMDYKTLRKAIRVGISDKKPGKDIGFMGIGIYSSFHLCDTLLLFTKKEGLLPQYLKIDFVGMRTLLEEEKQKRLAGEMQSSDLKDLQTLLQEFVDIPEEGTVPLPEYPITGSGTRVELVGLNSVLDEQVNNFVDMANYLEDVVPLRFNKKKFHWAGSLESDLKAIVERNHEKFELIDLKLQVGSKSEQLYRPYTDDIFSNDKSFEPDLQEIKSGGHFLGVAWGCLNSSRDRIKLPKDDIRSRNLRGFIIKKHGFSIGTREGLSKYFGPSNTFYHRYTGEVIIVNKGILPNASRNDLETSELKKLFILQMREKTAPHYIKMASRFQEQDVARDKVQKAIGQFMGILGAYNPYEDNYNNYVEQIGVLGDVINEIRAKVKKLSDSDKKEAELIIAKSEALKKEIMARLIPPRQQSSSTKSKPTVDNATQIAEDISSITLPQESKSYESLTEMLKDLDLDINLDLKTILELIDDKFIKAFSTSKSQYYRYLNQLKEDFENGTT
ncbi:ATP-binding protein [Mucilaginibacter sp.]